MISVSEDNVELRPYFFDALSTGAIQCISDMCQKHRSAFHFLLWERNTPLVLGDRFIFVARNRCTEMER